MNQTERYKLQNVTPVGNPAVQPAAAAGVPERPALAPNVVLAGEMPDTGFADKQWLVMRDGNFIQLGELLYRVAELSNGERTLDEIAQRMTETSEWTVTAEHVVKILQKMMPLGIIALEPAAEAVPGSPAAPARQGQKSMLGINMKVKMIGGHVIQPIARVLQVLYRPVILIPLLVLMAAAHLWLYLAHGVSQAFMDVLYRPWGFPIILGLMVLAGVVHEFGHAAALTYGGGKVRGMGAGIYIIYPAFYTDLTDSYRLSRWGRLRTDLGGFYFYLIFALAIIGLYLLTGLEFLLLTVLFINLDILYQSIPFMRLDGYWALADLTGIPDPLTYMKPFLESLVAIPGRAKAKVAELRPNIKRIFLIYTLLTTPLLIAGLIFMIYRLPRFLIRFYDSIAYQVTIIPLAWRNGDYPGVIILVFSVLLLSAMILGTLYIFLRLARGFITGLWNWSKPTTRRRVGGAAVAALAVALLAVSWLPHFQSLLRVEPRNVQTFEVTSREHVDPPVSYQQSPPVGGNHAEVWQNCGFYDAPIANENAVHSLEHGAVWVTYHPDLPARQVTELRQLAYRQAFVLVSPYADQSAPVVASAWGKQLQLQSAADPGLEQFIRAYRLSDQAPEPGESCIGGIGSPK